MVFLSCNSFSAEYARAQASSRFFVWSVSWFIQVSKARWVDCIVLEEFLDLRKVRAQRVSFCCWKSNRFLLSRLSEGEGFFVPPMESFDKFSARAPFVNRRDVFVLQRTSSPLAQMHRKGLHVSLDARGHCSTAWGVQFHPLLQQSTAYSFLDSSHTSSFDNDSWMKSIASLLLPKPSVWKVLRPAPRQRL